MGALSLLVLYRINAIVSLKTDLRSGGCYRTVIWTSSTARRAPPWPVGVHPQCEGEQGERQQKQPARAREEEEEEKHSRGDG
jgi:hypothetical protein